MQRYVNLGEWAYHTNTQLQIAESEIVISQPGPQSIPTQVAKVTEVSRRHSNWGHIDLSTLEFLGTDGFPHRMEIQEPLERLCVAASAVDAAAKYTWREEEAWFSQ